MPSFIRYSIINENQEQLKKISHILNELYNIYLTINNKNSSIISLTTKEYKKHFEEMIYKLKESGLNLSEIKELKDLKVKDYDIKNLILLPELNNFIVNENNMEQESLIDNFNYVKENNKRIIKNLSSEIDNNNNNYFCLIKNKEGDNNDKIEKSIFNFENLNQIFLNEYLSNLKGIISDNSYIEKNRKILIFK